MKKFLIMIQFLTRIPLNTNLDVEESDFSEGIIYFPLVGSIIGIFITSIFMLFNSYISYKVAIVMAVMSEIMITGALHLDGLADTFDGVYSNRDKDRILEIMKDSRIGSNGVLALMGVLALKITLILSVSEDYIYPILFFMPIVSRFTVPFFCYGAKYAREKGMGNFFIGKVTLKQLMITLVIYIILATFNKNIALVGIPVLAISYLYRRHIEKIIGGLTGDIIGSNIEIMEIVFLIISFVVINLNL